MLPESKSQVARSNNYIKDQTYGLCIGNKVEKSLSLKGLSNRRLNEINTFYVNYKCSLNDCIRSHSTPVTFSLLKVGNVSTHTQKGVSIDRYLSCF